MSAGSRTWPLALCLACFLVSLTLIPGSTKAQTVSATANGEDLVLVVKPETPIMFKGSVAPSLMDNVTAKKWDFSRDVYDKEGEWEIERTFFARGQYDVSFQVTFDDGSTANHSLRVFVYHDEEDEPSLLDFWSDFPPWLYTLLAGMEIMIGLVLFGATYRLKQTKIYLQEPPPKVGGE